MPNHLALLCKLSNEYPHEEEETETDTDEFFYKVEEAPSAQTRGEQFYTTLKFCDPDAGYKTKSDCQLDTGATCTELTHCGLSVIGQAAYPAIKSTEVKLRLFHGNVLKPMLEHFKFHREVL